MPMRYHTSFWCVLHHNKSRCISRVTRSIWAFCLSQNKDYLSFFLAIVVRTLIMRGSIFRALYFRSTLRNSQKCTHYVYPNPHSNLRCAHHITGLLTHANLNWKFDAPNENRNNYLVCNTTDVGPTIKKETLRDEPRYHRNNTRSFVAHVSQTKLYPLLI